ncbi:hypothetical protein BDW74DRAFT_183567 [Aspergillus multicolor]|uniref:uncharacterized protein n=1 Tax=Aspergillus multicolor TaxID=41759 RepID=UPI003CCCCCB5
MRVPIGHYVVALLTVSAGLSDAVPTAGPMKFNARFTNGTDTIFTEQDIKGGIEWSYKPLMAFATCTATAFAIMSYVKKDSEANSCAPLWGSQKSDDGTQAIDFYYYVTTTVENCDTTAQTKTIADAIEKVWDEVHDKKYDYACIELSHWGTWRGHLAIATKTSGVDVETLCPAKNWARLSFPALRHSDLALNIKNWSGQSHCTAPPENLCPGIPWFVHTLRFQSELNRAEPHSLFVVAEQWWVALSLGSDIILDLV